MIRVERAPTPNHFERLVSEPGLARLESDGINPDTIAPPKYEFEPYWSRVQHYTRWAYSYTCAYFGIRIDKNTGSNSTDHFLSKARHESRLAYEWENYRLACGRVNSRKGEKQVLDPFEIEDNWFNLDLESGFLQLQETNIPAELYELAKFTLSSRGLDLNSDDLIEGRSDQWFRYLNNDISANILEEDCPIVYRQAVLQKRI